MVDWPWLPNLVEDGAISTSGEHEELGAEGADRGGTYGRPGECVGLVNHLIVTGDRFIELPRGSNRGACTALMARRPTGRDPGTRRIALVSLLLLVGGAPPEDLPKLPSPRDTLARLEDGAGFYVSPNGNDANPGTLGAPFRTLSRCRAAMQGQNSTGTKICTLRAGTYPLSSTLTLTSADDGETWQFYGPDGYDTAILDGGATGGATGILCVICIVGGSNITINGLQVQHFAQMGIGVHGGADPGYFGSGPFATRTMVATANANVIENNLVHDGFASSRGDTAAPFNSGGILGEGQVTNTKVHNNVVYNQADNGIRFGSNDNGNTPRDIISGTDIEGNVVYGTGGGRTETSCYYIQDTNANSTAITVKNNWGRDCGDGPGDQKRGLYFDEGASNITATGNVIIVGGGAAFSKGGDTAQFVSSGHNDTIQYNLYDLGATAQVVTYSYLQSSASLASTGNVFNLNVIVGNWAGGQRTSEFGSIGKSLIQGCSSCGTFTAPTAFGNDWFNYGGGLLPPTGNAFNDASPRTLNPGIIGTCEKPQFGPAITSLGIAQLPSSYGPPGYSGPPVKACSWAES